MNWLDPILSCVFILFCIGSATAESWGGSELRQSIDESVDPCENFYNFVCGHSSGHSVQQADEMWRQSTYAAIREDLYRNHARYPNISAVYAHMRNLCDSVDESVYIQFQLERLQKFNEYLKTNPQASITDLMLQILPSPMFYRVGLTGETSRTITLEISYNIAENYLHNKIEELRESMAIWKGAMERFREAGIVDVQANVLSTVGEFQNFVGYGKQQAKLDLYLSTFLPKEIRLNLTNANMKIEDLPVTIPSFDTVEAYERVIFGLSRQELIAFAKLSLTRNSRAFTAEECKDLTDLYFMFLTNRVYYDEFKLDLNKVHRMVDQIRRQLKKAISNSAWIDKAGQEKARRKLNETKVELGAPESFLKDTVFYSFFETLNVSAIMASKSIAEVGEIVTSWYEQQYLRQLVPSERWAEPLFGEDHVTSYDLLENVVSIPRSYLSGPFYQRQRPTVLNYGLLGLTLAYEMGQAVGVKGQHYDSRGYQRDLWDTKLFDQRVKCFIEKYSDYTVNGIHVLTEPENMQENIADHISIRASYGAFQHVHDKHLHARRSIEGLEKYDVMQQFFMSAASLFCEDPAQDDYFDPNAAPDTHSPAEARVNVMLSQINEFANAFNCKSGTPMNPADKCSIW